MTAKVIRLYAAAPRPGISRHLLGQCRQTAGGRMAARMQGESAVRAFVRSIGRRLPISDSEGRDDTWAQVEDVVALVPGLTSSTGELEALTIGTMRTLAARRGGGFAVSDAVLSGCRLKISAHRRTLRLAFADARGSRVITFRLLPDGATRIDDTTSAR